MLQVDYIWKRKKGPLDFLLILVRYSTIIAACVYVYFTLHVFKQHEIYRCFGFNVFRGIINPIIVSACDSILAIRIWALYRRNNTILCLLVFCIIGQALTNLTVIIRLTIQSKTLLDLETLNITGCWPSRGSTGRSLHRSAELMALPCILNATIMFLLSTVRCVRHIIGAQWQTMSFTTLLLRDGVLYFLSVLVLLTMQLLLFFINPVVQGAISPLIFVTCSIASLRVLFNMRALNSEDDPDSQTIQLSTLRFWSQSNGQDSESMDASSHNPDINSGSRT